MNSSLKDEKILSYLRQVNEQMQDFMRTALEFHEIQEEAESLLQTKNSSAAVARCWEEFRCIRKECPAHRNSDIPCWKTSGTLCGRGHQEISKPQKCSCHDCKVFRQYADNAVLDVYESIGLMARYLGDRARKTMQLEVNDSLTGLHNRNYLQTISERLVETADRRTKPLSLILFDLNKFRSVNEQHGHMAGDDLLKEFGEFLRKYTREAELLFRLGDDEFLLLMDGADAKQCRAAERRLLDAITTWNKNRKGKVPENISFSLGSVTAHRLENFENLMTEAYEKLEANKNHTATTQPQDEP